MAGTTTERLQHLPTDAEWEPLARPLCRRRPANSCSVDVTKCGGLSEGKRIAALADAFGKYVTTHTTTVGVGLASHLHYWASTPACRYAQEYNVVSGKRPEGVLASPLVPRDGFLAVPHGPGLGIELIHPLIERDTAA